MENLDGWGGGLQLKFPPWWGSGYFLETHIPVRCLIISNFETFCKNRSLRGHELTGNEYYTINNVCVVP